MATLNLQHATQIQRRQAERAALMKESGADREVALLADKGWLKLAATWSNG
jgi:hypothetical protein